MGIGSCSYEPRSPICHPHAENSGKTAVEFEGLRVESRWHGFQTISEALRTRATKGKILMLQHKQSGREGVERVGGSEKERERGGGRASKFCSIQTLTRGQSIYFTQSTNSNANLFLKHPHRHSEIMFNQLSGHPVIQSS